MRNTQSEETVEFMYYKKKEFRAMNMKNLSQGMKVRLGFGC